VAEKHSTGHRRCCDCTAIISMWRPSGAERWAYASSKDHTTSRILAGGDLEATLGYGTGGGPLSQAGIDSRLVTDLSPTADSSRTWRDWRGTATARSRHRPERRSGRPARRSHWWIWAIEMRCIARFAPHSRSDPATWTRSTISSRAVESARPAGPWARARATHGLRIPLNRRGPPRMQRAAELPPGGAIPQPRSGAPT